MSKLKRNCAKFIFVVLLLFYFPLISWEKSLFSNQKKISPFPKIGMVIAVYDGDTIKVRFSSGQEKRVRLIGIDSPEIDDPRGEKRFYAFMAKRFTFYYLYRRAIKLSYEEGELEDKYGRLLAYVWTEKQGLFNKFIISQGFASAFLNFPFRYRKEFSELEEEARRLEKGFWSKDRYPLISVAETKNHFGSLVIVQFLVARIEAKGRYIFLHASQEDFSALIPQENIYLFPEIKSLKGQELSVTGFLEEYKGKPQIVVFFPRQIKMHNLSGSKTPRHCPSFNLNERLIFLRAGKVFFGVDNNRLENEV